MKILISQRDLRIPPNNFLFDCLERSWYNLLDKHQLIPLANIGVIDESIDFDCLVLSGGPDSLARNTTENLWFAHTRKLNKPIVGVCHGAFAITDITGGKLSRKPGHDNISHTVRMEGQIHVVNSFHSQYIESMNPDMIVIATDEEDHVEAFQHKTDPIYGIVWHPERMKDPVLPSAVKELLL
jgi:putative glutamine amidotransferase